MRNKIIAVNAVIVIIVSVLAFAIVKTQLSLATRSADQLKRAAQRDAIASATKLQLDALRAERWLSTKAAEPATLALLAKATHAARADAARQLSDRIASEAPAALGARPSIVAVVDANGKILGRNGSDIGRDSDVGEAYPAFKDALSKMVPGSDVWSDTRRADQYLASYVPVRDDSNRSMMLVLGVALNDALARVAEASAGRGVLLVNGSGEVFANSSMSEDVKAAVRAGAGDLKGAAKSGTGASGLLHFAAAPLDGFGDRTTAVVAVAPAAMVEGVSSVPNAILGVMALGLVLVVAGGWFLGNYVSRPINALEEGLLSILNGQTDKRFELQHAELGGLAFRIDQLLNQLMGIEEDDTDEHGRVSRPPPPAAAISDAYGVGSQRSGGVAQEPAEDYYARLYGEYIAAKRSLGEEVAHITSDAFRARIEAMEQDALRTHGRPVRYAVQVNGQEVVLLATPR